MTTLLPLTCNHCGAAIEVEPGVRFLTCTHCGSRLEVHRTGSAAYTSVLESIDQRTQQIAEDVETLKLQHQLEQLDREWDLRRQSLLIRNKDGSTSEPSALGNAAGIIMGVFAMGFAIFWMVTASSMGAPFPFPCFGLIFLIVVPLVLAQNLIKTNQFQQERARYEAEREQLASQLRDRPQ